MYPQRQTSVSTVQDLPGQRLVNLAFILALIAIVVVVALSLLGPALGNTTLSAGNAHDPAASSVTSDPDSSAPALYRDNALAVDVVNAAALR